MLEAGGREKAGERGPRPPQPQSRVRSWDKLLSSKKLEGVMLADPYPVPPLCPQDFVQEGLN